MQVIKDTIPTYIKVREAKRLLKDSHTIDKLLFDIDILSSKLDISYSNHKDTIYELQDCKIFIHSLLKCLILDDKTIEVNQTELNNFIAKYKEVIFDFKDEFKKEQQAYKDKQQQNKETKGQ